MLMRLQTANEEFFMIHTNIRARTQNRIYLQFYHNQIEYVEKHFFLHYLLKGGQNFPPNFCFIQFDEIERAIVTQYIAL